MAAPGDAHSGGRDAFQTATWTPCTCPLQNMDLCRLPRVLLRTPLPAMGFSLLAAAADPAYEPCAGCSVEARGRPASLRRLPLPEPGVRPNTAHSHALARGSPRCITDCALPVHAAQRISQRLHHCLMCDGVPSVAVTRRGRSSSDLITFVSWCLHRPAVRACLIPTHAVPAVHTAAPTARPPWLTLVC